MRPWLASHINQDDSKCWTVWSSGTAVSSGIQFNWTLLLLWTHLFVSFPYSMRKILLKSRRRVLKCAGALIIPVQKYRLWVWFILLEETIRWEIRKKKMKRKVILRSLLMSQHKVMVTFNVIRNDKRKYFFKTACTSTVEFMSLEDILDRDYRKFQQRLKNCLYDIKTQKYKRTIYF